jgi:hypothetical protein
MMRSLRPLSAEEVLLALGNVASRRLLPTNMIHRHPVKFPRAQWVPTSGERLEVDDFENGRR